MNRRLFLQQTLAGAAALALNACSAPSASPLTVNTPPAPTRPAPSSRPELEIALEARPAETALLDGARTRTWSYTGQVLKGDPAALQSIPNSYLGPTIHAWRGQKVRIRFTNNLPSMMTCMATSPPNRFPIF